MAFEDIGKKLTQSGQDVLQKSKNFSEINRLESEIRNMEKENELSYAQIGRLYYQKNAGQQPDPDFSAQFASISANLQGIEIRRAQVRELKGVVQCPGCGEDVSKEATFCNNCGTRLIAIVPDTSGFGSCPGCGAAVDEGQKFCTRCGRKLDVIVHTQQTPPPAPKNVCRSCGQQLEAGMAYCIYCGTRVEVQSTPVRPAAPEDNAGPAPEVPRTESVSEPAQEPAAEMPAEEPAAQETPAASETQTTARPGSEFTWQEYQAPQEEPAADLPAFCTQCGSLLEPDMIFCTACGTRVGS